MAEVTNKNIQVKHCSQRVGVFVDVQNLYYSAKAVYKARVNFKSILDKAVSDRNLIRAITYVIKADVQDEQTFFDALSKMGFEVKAKDLQIFYGGQKKGDWDVGIAMDIMRLASKLDVVVLASGDGDFTDLLVHAKALGCKTEVLAFQKSASAKLIEVADEFVNLGVDGTYIISPSKSARRPVKKPVETTKKIIK
ncbi:NYN domain-containing protein [Patescibacteria group bacterium]|nr:NYN domain-containing protein [Patescibacteria group bacterium]